MKNICGTEGSGNMALQCCDVMQCHSHFFVEFTAIVSNFVE